MKAKMKLIKSQLAHPELLKNWLRQNTKKKTISNICSSSIKKEPRFTLGILNYYKVLIFNFEQITVSL